MEAEVKAIFNDLLLTAGAEKFGSTLDQLSYIGAWQNFVYEYKEKGKSYILRFTPSTHRSENLVKGELDWIQYLAHNGVAVSEPVASRYGNLTEVVQQDDMQFTVTSFVKAEGSKMGYPECLTDIDLYQRLGKVTGKMHALSKKYELQDESIRRHDWNQNYYLSHMEKFVPASQSFVFEARNLVMNKIRDTLPKDQNSYGLIHGDLGVGNYTVSGNERLITLFDFDEAQYSWFIEDIAIPLYYLVYVYGGVEGKEDRESQALRFMDSFLKGYDQENSLEEDWLKQLPLFLQLRELIAYTGMYRSADMAQLNQWGKDYIAQCQVRMEHGIPIVDIWS